MFIHINGKLLAEITNLSVCSLNGDVYQVAYTICYNDLQNACYCIKQFIEKWYYYASVVRGMFLYIIMLTDGHEFSILFGYGPMQN